MINTEKTWRGGERQTLYLCEGLVKKGVDITLLARKDYPLYKRANESGIRTIGVTSSLEAMKFILKNRKKFAIIHSQTGKGVSLALPARLLPHSPPLFYTRRVDFKLQGYFTLWKYRKIDQLIGISDAICQILRLSGLENVVRITSAVVPRELNTTRARSFIEKLGIDHPYVVGTIAALVPHKDPFNLLEAARKVIAHRDDVAFVVFGDGPLREQIQEKIHEYQLQKYFFLAGFQPDVEDFYSQFDLFVMSSQEEGLGSAVLDAFYYEVPVIATEAGGLKELVQGRGELCPVKDPKCLAEKINRLLDDEDLKDKYRKLAKEYVLTHHNLNQIVEQYISLYKQHGVDNVTD